MRIYYSSQDNSCYPGGSKSKVNKAGENIRNGTATEEDEKIVENWRGAHRYVLNTFNVLLRKKIKGKNITIGQRHKRKSTIYDKLQRHRSMQLARMDDIAGCRLIFQNIQELEQFRKKFHGGKYLHELVNDVDKYNYILTPKRTGYRGIHDIYRYKVETPTGANLSGLYVEIQYRTEVQHSWATANEIIGQITRNRPKFESGDQLVIEQMALASEILSRSFENCNSCLPELSNKELIDRFDKLERKFKLIDKLRKVVMVQEHLGRNNAILRIVGEKLYLYPCASKTDAVKNMFQLERAYPQSDLVLVHSATGDMIRKAFKNYFFDSSDFLHMIDEGREILALEPSKSYYSINFDDLL